MAQRQAKQDVLAARVAGLSFDPGGWLGAARSDALNRLHSMGLPDKRDEYWRYTDPASLTASGPQAPVAVADHMPVFGLIDQIRIVFVDGVFDPAQSDNLAQSGVQIERLASVAHDIHWARDIYGVVETAGQSPVPRPLAMLNSAFATDGVLIRATAAVSKPVSLIYLRKTDSSDVILHHCVKVEAGATLTILESGAAAARFNSVMEVQVAAGARLHHIRLQGRDHARHAATHVFARVAEAGLFKSFTLTKNGALTRNEAVITLAGDDAAAHIAGATVGDGAFHHDDTVFVIHQGQRCESRQVFKKVLKNGAVGVFQGKILVTAGAQKTDGYQISQALLLDEDCQFLAKPELEIYADDVKCSHGSTSGAIDAGALFYLRSRGVSLREAQSLLMLAFLAEAIDEIDDDAIADSIRSFLEGWLARHSQG